MPTPVLDKAAFDALFRDMYGPLHFFAQRITGGDKTAADDVVSEVFLQLWEQRSQLNNDCYLRAYLYTSTRNRSLNWLRNQQAAHAREERYALFSTPIDDNAITERLFQAETLRVLHAAIAELPPECRRVVELGLKGLGTNEIARELNISASAVSHQKARAVRLLKEKVPLSLLMLIGLAPFAS